MRNIVPVPKLNLGTRTIDTYLGNSTGIPMRGQII